jgi:hypothetical protein
VRFSGAAAANSEIKTKTTAALILRLSDVNGLESVEQGDVVLSVSGDANTGVITGIPEKVGETWNIPVAGIDTEGTVTVTLTRNGYRFEPSPSIEVPVHYAKPVALVTAAAADGDELLAQPTTQITLTFDEPVDGLTLNDITVTANKTGATPAALEGNENKYKYTLTLQKNSVTASGKIGVEVTKDGYDITNSTVPFAVYDNQYNYLATGGSSITVTKENNGYYETHKFTSTAADQSLAFTNSVPAGLKAQVLVVGGGGGGGKSGGTSWRAGGGGGGAVLIHSSYELTSSSYSVTVGGGGAAATSSGSGYKGSTGGTSKFGSAFTARGGGGGGSHENMYGNSGAAGGSGGGGAGPTFIGGGVVASTVPTGGAAYSGNSGAAGPHDYSGGGGGGAGGAGVAATGAKAGAKGGIGIASSITGTEVFYGGGGTGGSNVTQEDTRGAYDGSDGAANTGDGGCGGGGSSSVSGSAGGSGIVVVRFPVPSAQ